MDERWRRWYECSLCEQQYHGVVMHALGWACWKTYLERPETDRHRIRAMNMLGKGLYRAGHHEDALSVSEAELAMKRRLSAPEEVILTVQGNLANLYGAVGRCEQALQLRRDVYSGYLNLLGEEHEGTLKAALNYAASLKDLWRFEEAKALLRLSLIHI